MRRLTKKQLANQVNKIVLDTENVINIERAREDSVIRQFHRKRKTSDKTMVLHWIVDSNGIIIGSRLIEITEEQDNE